MKKKLHFSIRSRHLLAVMVILCIGLMLLSFSSEKAAKPLRSGAGVVVIPFQKGVNRIGTWFSEQFAGFQSVKALSEENAELRAQVDDLTAKNSELAQMQGELNRLEALYKLDQEYPEYNKVAAEVISKDPGNWYSTFVINKGSEDGIKKDMNVLAQGGLIGIVTETGRHWATVRAIIDDTSAISAMASITSETCIVEGSLTSMNNGKIRFQGLRDPDGQVVEGASIVTSNISENYVSGLLIGYVSDISLDSNNLTKSGTLIPAADFRALREVLIITDLKQTRENED